MSETTETTPEISSRTSMIIVVPSAWVTYEVDSEDVLFLKGFRDADGDPPVTVLEALVMVGRARRLAAIHTFNTVPDEDEPDESLFGEPDEDET